MNKENKDAVGDHLTKIWWGIWCKQTMTFSFRCQIAGLCKYSRCDKDRCSVFLKILHGITGHDMPRLPEILPGITW